MVPVVSDVLAPAVTVDHPGGIATGITVIDGAIPLDLIEKFYLLAVDAIPAIGAGGLTFGGLMPDVKHTRDLAMHDCATWPGEFAPDRLAQIDYDPFAMDAAMAAALKDVLAPFRQAFDCFAETSFDDSGYLLQMYRKGEGFYKSHVDSLPNAYPERILSVVIYLNDVDEGGETYFDRHDLGVKPRAGRACIFPSGWTHPHGSKVPISDDKYIISTFMSATPG